jgi:hypothetical protein
LLKSSSKQTAPSLQPYHFLRLKTAAALAAHLRAQLQLFALAQIPILRHVYRKPACTLHLIIKSHPRLIIKFFMPWPKLAFKNFK